MNITLFFAGIWGPIIIAIALGIFFSRSYYLRIYRDMEKEPLAILVFGMMAMLVGIIQIQVHNSYQNLSEIVVSLLGWGFLVKGALFLIIPRLVDRLGDAWVQAKALPVAGILLLIIGGYLSWISYLA